MDGQTTLLDNAMRMLLQLLTAWKNSADKAGNGKNSQMDQTLSQDPNSSKPDIATTLHMAEGFALVMFCHIRSAPRRLAFHSLKEVKALFKILNVNMNNEIPVLDALDKCSSEVAKQCPVGQLERLGAGRRGYRQCEGTAPYRFHQF